MEEIPRRTALTLVAALPLVAQLKGEIMSNPVVHFENGCRDLAKTGKFFSDLFGWHTETAGPASMIDTGSKQGIQGHITALGHEPQNYTIFYVQVDDVQASLDKAASLGGKMLVPPIKIPTGTFAWFADPEGNTIGLLKRG
jgi:predicted enzyme related to lactoylglutathione lyase